GLIGNPARANERLTAAADTFRAGDCLVDLAETLPLLAECTRASGDLDAADRYAAEAITLAGPRRLIPAQAAALATRAHIYAHPYPARAAQGARPTPKPGPPAATAAPRLAPRHQLAWHQLDALTAHAHLDTIEGVDHGWTQQAAALHTRLVPTGLDLDPLTTV